MVHPGRYDPARAGAVGTLRARRGARRRRRRAGDLSARTQTLLNVFSDWPTTLVTRVVNAALWRARGTRRPWGRDWAVHSTWGRLRFGTPADHAGHEGRGRGGRGGRARQRTRFGSHPARRRGGSGGFLGRRPALGDPAGARLAGPGGAAGVVQPPPDHAAVQPGRDRVPGDGAGARGRARRRLVRASLMGRGQPTRFRKPDPGHWPGRTPGTSHTTGSECIGPLRFITYHEHDRQ